jgi:TetR/AcrR family transcriptional repressor of multidrug resistance operon
MDILIDKRTRILNAAAELIVQNGLQCSMAAVAERANVATGSLYNYFPSKHAMIRAVYDQLATTVENLLVVEIDRTRPHRERILAYAYTYIDLIWEDPERALLFEYLSNVPLIPPAEMAEAFSRVSAYTTALMEEARADGAIKPHSSHLMAALLGGAIRNSLKWHRIWHSTLSPRDRDQIAEMCWSAIAAEP